MIDKELQIVDHLEELRKRIIISAVAFVVFFIVGFMFTTDIYKWFAKGIDMKLSVLGPSDILWVYFMLATVVAIAGTIPVIAMQIWLFVRPALRPKERKVTLTYVPALFFLFIIGLAFGYFVIFPMILSFLLHLGQDMFVAQFTAEKYFQFMMNVTLPFGVLFELPVVVMFLTSLGILNPYVLSAIRKYAYFILVVIAVVITPPDFVSDFIVTIPLLVLYEISIFLSKFVFRKQLKRQQEEEKEWNVYEQGGAIK
ncbi:MULTISPECIES: twin-arginine translocase subunit TatC [unclassified Bacillus (in: firmicutes)]|uniref:twin-arginine translocase subunit TatC n=1 Tax=unclassified Bacillus (in: firmicutes) TaxID=185979 RepID=UPI00232EB127|nr:twin-arginine translocase subunit TatC [Bacillus sp. BP-3]MDC2864067.1 twin-arginine translocase subunit TatC [Bacillus sp. BP-3]